MSYLAFSLLLYMGEGYECFKCFANLLSQHFCFDFIRLKRDKVNHSLLPHSSLPSLMGGAEPCVPGLR